MSIIPHETFVLITGASSGLGSEFARYYARRGYSLVLHGRRETKLRELARELESSFFVQTEIIVGDLGNQDDVAQLVARIQQTDRSVEVLINNAGFGLGKAFEKSDMSEHIAQVDILAKTPLVLMHAAVESMLAKGHGSIINVASVAAFTPGGTYSAVKRFLVSISESAHLQYASRGIKVTAVCPGLVHTGFHRAMGEEKPKLPSLFWEEPATVVNAAVTANRAGRAIVVPTLTYRILAGGSRILPRKLVGSLLARTRDY